MKIGLVGYGKMGKAIEEIAIERGHEILFKSNSVFPLTVKDIDMVDVVIEFTGHAEREVFELWLIIRKIK